MDSPRICLLVLPLLLVNLNLVEARDFFVVERSVETPSMGLDAASDDLERRRKQEVRKIERAVRAAGGEVLISRIPLPMDRLEERVSGRLRYRFRGQVRAFFCASKALPQGLLKDARALGPNDRFVLSVHAMLHLSTLTALPFPQVSVSAEELRWLLRSPTQVKYSALGAQLREAWLRALGGRKDAPMRYEGVRKKIEANLRIERVTFKGGAWLARHYLGLYSDLDEQILGRKLTFKEGLQKRLGRARPLPKLSARQAKLLEDALAQATQTEARERLAKLRRSDPRAFSKQDVAFLRKLSSTKHKGLAARLR